MERTVFFRGFFALFVAILIAGTFVALSQGDDRATISDAERVALELVGEGTIQPARVEDDEWEVDVVRPDGSLVEVTLNHELDLIDFDEERGPGGRLAGDELTGSHRRQAISAAFRVTGVGHVTTVERDSADEIEVGVRLTDGSQIEVELDSELRVGEVEPEDPEDE